MKSAIHPKYYKKAVINCVCGNAINIGSTKERMDVEICNKCHPFYTGAARLVDAAGRVDKFKTRKTKSESASKIVRKTRTKKNIKVTTN